MNLASFAGPPATLIACSRAVSLFFGTDDIKQCFPSKVKHCIRGEAHTHNEWVLKSVEIGVRLKKAMEEAEPQVSGADLAHACKVSPQAVSGWRRTGRFSKRHLPTIARLTGRPVEYFISETIPARSNHVSPTKPWLYEKVIDEEKFLIVFRTWQDARDTDRENLVAIAKTARQHGTRRRKGTSSI
jgi:transcriptional regulator with XRE-family HTH domain